MFHLLAHFGNLAAGPVDVPAITDQIFSTRNNHYTPGEDLQLIAAAGLGDELIRVINNSARVRAINPPILMPITNAALWTSNPQINDFRNFPFLIKNSEELIWQAVNAVAGPTDTWVLNWVRRAFTPAPRGEIYTLRGTSTTAAVDSAWTLINPTWDFQLPQGVYAVIGGAYYAAGSIAFRVVFDGQLYRPGGIGEAVEGDMPWYGQLNGELGLWGTFDTVTLPQVEVLCNAATAVHTFQIQVIRIR